MTVVLFVIMAVLLLSIVSGTYVFFVACVRRKEVPWLVKEELEKTSYSKFSEAIAASDKWLREHNATDIEIVSDDGLRLHGLWVSAENARGTVLLAHGYRSSYLLDFGIAFVIYHELGLNLLIPDQRAHGKSEGRYITFGVRESNDMLLWLKYHNDRFGRLPVFLNGLSMGASTMLFLADRPLPDNVRGIIADCGFTSPVQILMSVFKRVTHLPAFPTLLVTEMLARLVAGFSLWQRDSRRILQMNKLPIIMIHGTKDNFVPCDMTRQAYAQCAGEKQLLLVEGAGHGVSFLVDPDMYAQRVSRFIEDNL